MCVAIASPGVSGCIERLRNFCDPGKSWNKVAGSFYDYAHVTSRCLLTRDPRHPSRPHCIQRVSDLDRLLAGLFPGTFIMAKGTNSSELSEFEKQRLANIAERDALLKKLSLEAQSAGLFTAPKAPGSGAPKPKKKAAPKRIKEEEAPLPRRQSSRLRGLTADSEVVKRKAEEEYEAAREAERARKVRRTDAYSANDMFIAGQKLEGDSLIGVDVVNKGVAEPYVRTFGDDDIKKTTDKDLKALREEMNGLSLWTQWDPQSK